MSKKLPKLGTGKRFANLSNKLASKGITNPDALAAKIGRAKYGNKKFTKLAEHGKMNKAVHVLHPKLASK